MTNNQGRIFTQTQSHKDLSPSLNKRRQSLLKTLLLSVYHGAGLVLSKGTQTITIGMFLWGSAGEIFLPVEYRLTTFIGKRIATTRIAEIELATPTEANRQQTMTAAQGAVELAKNCQQQRTNAAQQIYTQCMSDPTAVITGCEMQRDAILQLDCTSFTPESLSPAYELMTSPE